MLRVSAESSINCLTMACLGCDEKAEEGCILELALKEPHPRGLADLDLILKQYCGFRSDINEMRPPKAWEGVILHVGGTGIIARQRTDGGNQPPRCLLMITATCIPQPFVVPFPWVLRMVCVTKRIWQTRWYAMSESGYRTGKHLSMLFSLIRTSCWGKPAAMS